MIPGFDSQPTLKGHKLMLRPLVAEDYTNLYRVAADPLIWQGHPATDRYQPDQFQLFFDEALNSKGALVAVDVESIDIIGSSRFFPYPNDTSQIEIGWSFLARSHWGGAANGEMKWLMINHAYQVFDRVYFRVGSSNLRSQKAILKVGAKEIDTNESESGEVWIHYCIQRKDANPA